MLVLVLLATLTSSVRANEGHSLRGSVPSSTASDSIRQQRTSTLGNFGMVSTSHGLAGKAAAETLERGGNAVDAALVVHLVLAVVEPQHVSIAGGGVLLYKPWAEATVHIDFREEAPSKYHPKTFCRNQSCLLDPECGCSDGAFDDLERCTGGHATGTPGFPALLALAQRDNLTSLPLEELAAPAIYIARNGFAMYEGLYRSIETYAPQLARNAAAARLFLDPSQTRPKVNVGESFKNPELADFLDRLVRYPEEFYSGALGAKFLAAQRAAVNPITGKYGLLSRDDLAGYRAVYRKPVTYTHRTTSGETYEIHGSAPPFSGGIAQAQIFNYLEPLNSMAFGNSTRRLGYFMDAQNAAFADRNQYVADADFVDVNIASLASKGYASGRVQELFSQLHTNGEEQRALSVPLTPGQPESGANQGRGLSTTDDHGTAHVTIIDPKGNIVAMTTSVNMIMGSRVVVPGHGYLLNDQLCDFDPVGIDGAGKMNVNAAEGIKRPRRTALGDDRHSLGGKRPRSSMSPTVVVPAAAGCGIQGAAAAQACNSSPPFVLLGLGAPGGSDIIGGVANVLRNVFQAAPQEAEQLQWHTDEPRAIGKNSLEMKNARVELAMWTNENVSRALGSWGYSLTFTDHAPPYYVGETYGRVQSAMLLQPPNVTDPIFVGAADSLRLPACTVIAPRAPEFQV